MALLKLQGTYNATRHARRKHEPTAGGEIGEPPKWLTRRQLALWRQIAKAAAAANLLGTIDRSLFINFVLLADAQRDMVGDPKELRLTGMALARIGGELGFTPVSRAKLGRPEPYPIASETERWGDLKVVGGKR